MEQYTRTQRGSSVESAIQPNEIRVGPNGKIKSYVEHAIRIVNDPQYPGVVVTGKGAAINKAVTVVEITKRQLSKAGLGKASPVQQRTKITSEETVDVWEPIDEHRDLET
ncbi:hypothetical protein CXG81DRAFT_25376 [Caulochytrium protostelioides]|uniref:DNA/RNA-binding protein Alba-like domain-containing protein n=1 Tax=Caulochytrium protostelioides TaxID=1555241 RepID=A0A4P9X9I6_9FUNG|nr:hypothetical protein CXG81DRAFT_25376 [Caulochytrium protostelioides]|eukprot:RKP01956.1 hypothetical protein CXG81DRAFT_25376 [Caulochytrium protostelioides]